MLQDPNKGSMPKVDTSEVAGIATQAAGMVTNKLAEQAGEDVKKAKAKIQKGGQLASQVTAYAGMAQQFGGIVGAGSNGQHHTATEDTSVPPSFNGNSNKKSNAAAIAASEVFGVSHLTKLTIVVEGTQIKHYKHFQLSQSAIGHHSFSLVLDHDSLGSPENHQMEQAQKLMGKRILVTFAYKNVLSGSPERDFIGVVTKVGYSRENGNRGHIILKGSSPTILLDAAPHIQSFGGTAPVALSNVAQTLLKEGLGDKYKFRVEPNFTDNLTYSCQYDETHYNYLARMAEAYGEQFFYDGNTVHFGKLPFAEKAIPLTFGKDVEEVEIEMRTRHVNRVMYGYNSSNHELLTTGETKIKHRSSLAKVAYDASEKTFQTPSLRMAPLKANTSKNVEAAQKSTTGSEAVNVFITTGRTSVPFLYPGCVVDMNMRKPDSADTSYLTRLMITEIIHSVDVLGNYTGHFEGIAEGTGYLPTPMFHMPVAEPQIATVTDNKDDKGRVQVKFDWQPDGSTTEWIRVMSPDAGGSDKVSKNRGFVAIPEKGDQVMIGFVYNHPDRPYVMGGLFHGKVGGGGGEGNNIKSLSSKSGHIVELNDGGGITVRDKTGGNLIVIDGTDTISGVASKTISLTNGKSTIIMHEENISIEAKNISINGTSIVAIGSGGASVSVTSKGDVAGISGKEVIAYGSKEVKVAGKEIAVNAKTKLSMDGSGEAIITGGIVKINS
jgi:uncharacterized protein involved in type VI secretion and phage assembly